MELSLRVAALVDAHDRGDATGFIQHVQGALLEKSNFRLLQDLAGPALHGTDNTSQTWLFFLKCIEAATADGFIGAQPVSHLVLELVPKPIPRSPEVAAAAAATFLGCCRARHTRVAVKLAQVYQLAVENLPAGAEPEVVQLVQQLLSAGGTAASGVALLMQFPALQPHFDVPGILEELVAAAQLTTAARWAEVLGRELQVQYVTHCLQFGHLKSAARAVKDFGLQLEFPDVEATYKRKTLDKLVAKGLWGVAATYVGDDTGLQAELIHTLLLAGEGVLAQEYCHLFGRTDLASFGIDKACLEAERQRRAEAFLQLSLSAGRLHFVDSLPKLEAMRLALCEQLGLPSAAPPASAVAQPGPPQGQPAVPGAGGGTGLAVGGAAGGAALLAGPAAGPADGRVLMHDWAAARAGALPVVGLDVEWRPERQDDKGGSSPASIVQVATDTSVFLVDLLALSGAPEALTAALGPTLGSERVYKLGVGVSSDIRKLGASYPQVAAFRAVHGCLDLGTLWKQRHVPHRAPQEGGGGGGGNGSMRGRGREVGLSTLSEVLLGKPLDKSMQVSDWERRPLSEPQLRYAALDAHAAVLIFRGLQQLNPAFSSHSGLETYAFSVLLPPHAPASHKRHWSEADFSRREDDEDGSEGGGAAGPGPGLGGGGSYLGSRHMMDGDSTAGDKEDDSNSGMAAGDGQADGEAGREALGGGAQLAAVAQGGCEVRPPGPTHQQMHMQQRWHVVSSCGGQVAHLGGGSAAPGLQQADCLALLPPLVARHLRQHGLGAAAVPLPPPPGGGAGGSIEDAAAALGVPPHQVCKALAVVGTPGRGAALVLIPGSLRLSLRKALLLPRLLLPAHMIRLPAVAAVMGWPVKSTRLASRDECTASFGYPSGAMPPFMFAPDISIVMDHSLLPPPPTPAVPAPTWAGQQLASSSGGGSSPADGPSRQAPPSGSVSQQSGSGPWVFCGSGTPQVCLQLLPGQLRQLTPSAALVDVCIQHPPHAHQPHSAAAWPQGDPAATGSSGRGPASQQQQQQQHSSATRTASGARPRAAAGGVSARPWDALELRFLLDTMCTRLCRWLRCLGIDAEFVGAEVSRHEVAQLATATTRRSLEHGGRVFLTRDHRLAERLRAGAVFLLGSDQAEEQLGELLRHFGIKFTEDSLMSRCSKCNAAAFEVMLPRELARPHVPPRVFGLVEEFFRCGNCGKVFWVGPKSESALELMASMLGRLGIECPFAGHGSCGSCGGGSGARQRSPSGTGRGDNSSAWEECEPQAGGSAAAAAAVAEATARGSGALEGPAARNSSN